MNEAIVKKDEITDFKAGDNSCGISKKLQNF